MKTSKFNLIVCLMLVLAVCCSLAFSPLETAYAAHAYPDNGKLLYYVDCGNLVDSESGIGSQVDRGGIGYPNKTATVKMAQMGVTFEDLYNSSTDNVYGQDPISNYYWGFVDYGYANQWRMGKTGINDSADDSINTCRYINENNAQEGVLKYTFQVDDAETELKVVLGFAWFKGWGEHTNTITINGELKEETVTLNGGETAELSYENVVGVAEDGQYYVTIQIGDNSTMSSIAYILIQTENWVPGKNLTYTATNAFVAKGTTPTLTSSEGEVVEGEISEEAKAKINDAEYFSTVVIDVAVKGTDTVVEACSFTVIPAGCEYFVNVGDVGNGDLLLSDAEYSEELGYGYAGANFGTGWLGGAYYESVRWTNDDSLEYKFDVENGTYVVYFGSICYWWDGTRSMKYSIEGGNQMPFVPTSSGTTFRDGAVVSDGQLNLTFLKDGDTPLASFILVAKGYQVSFDSDGGNVIASQYLIGGETVTRPESPSKQAEGATKYVFEKWVDVATGEEYDFTAPVTGDVALKAIYSEEQVSYTVSFCDDESFPIDGIEAQTVLEGGKVVKPADPTKQATAQYTYTFEGWYNGETAWDFENDVVTGNMFLMARFTETPVLYTVDFVDEEGGALAEAQQVAYGAKVVAPANPEKQATAQYTYTFAGWYNGETAWDFENGVVEGALTLTAKFESTVRNYTLTITYNDGTATQTETYAYGEMAELNFAREGYTHVVTLNGEAITELQMVADVEILVTYTAIEVEEDSENSVEESAKDSVSVGESAPASGSASEKPEDKGCLGSIGGSSMAFLFAIALGFIIKKRK